MRFLNGFSKVGFVEKYGLTKTKTLQQKCLINITQASSSGEVWTISSDKKGVFQTLEGVSHPSETGKYATKTDLVLDFIKLTKFLIVVVQAQFEFNKQGV